MREYKIFSDNVPLSTSSELELTECYQDVSETVKVALDWVAKSKSRLKHKYDNISLSAGFSIYERGSLSHSPTYPPHENEKTTLEDWSRIFLDSVGKKLDIRRVGLGKDYQGLEKRISSVVQEFFSIKSLTQRNKYGVPQGYLSEVEDILAMSQANRFYFNLNGYRYIYLEEQK